MVFSGATVDAPRCAMMSTRSGRMLRGIVPIPGLGVVCRRRGRYPGIDETVLRQLISRRNVQQMPTVGHHLRIVGDTAHEKRSLVDVNSHHLPHDPGAFQSVRLGLRLLVYLGELLD